MSHYDEDDDVDDIETMVSRLFCGGVNVSLPVDFALIWREELNA